MAFAELNYKNYPNSERAKAQLQSARWNTKKDLTLLYPKKSAQELCSIAKSDFQQKEPAYNLSEDAINAFGYELLNQHKLNDALLIFKLNVELYPQSYNVFDSYGECLLELGKEQEGINAYNKSLELNPDNTNAKRVLAKLAKDKTLK